MLFWKQLSKLVTCPKESGESTYGSPSRAYYTTYTYSITICFASCCFSKRQLCYRETTSLITTPIKGSDYDAFYRRIEKAFNKNWEKSSYFRAVTDYLPTGIHYISQKSFWLNPFHSSQPPSGSLDYDRIYLWESHDAERRVRQQRSGAQANQYMDVSIRKRSWIARKHATKIECLLLTHYILNHDKKGSKEREREGKKCYQDGIRRGKNTHEEGTRYRSVLSIT